MFKVVIFTKLVINLVSKAFLQNLEMSEIAYFKINLVCVTIQLFVNGYITYVTATSSYKYFKALCFWSS